MTGKWVNSCWTECRGWKYRNKSSDGSRHSDRDARQNSWFLMEQVRGTDVHENQLTRDDGLDDITLSRSKLGVRFRKSQPILPRNWHQPSQTVAITIISIITELLSQHIGRKTTHAAGADLRQKASSATLPERPPLPTPPSSFLPSPLTPSPFPSPPLEVGLWNPARGSGERCKLPSGVWGGAPAEIEFGAFLP